MKLAVAGAGILAAGVMGVMADATATAAVVLVVGLGIVPPLILMSWRDRSPTLSESIQKVLR